MLSLKKGFAILLAVAIAAPVKAQTVDSTAGKIGPARTATITPPISPGELVRVWAQRARLDGAIASFARVDSNLVITGRATNPEARPREWAVPVDAVQRLEVYRGRPRSASKIVAGVIVGAALGAGIGYALTPYIECGGACDKEGELKPFESRMRGLKIGAPIGAILGGVVGGMSRPRWEAVNLSIR